MLVARTAIHCKTKDEARQLFSILRNAGYMWPREEKLNENDTKFEEFGKDTCYFLEDSKIVTYASLQIAKESFHKGEILHLFTFEEIWVERNYNTRFVDANALLSMPLLNGEYDKKNANEHFMFGIETAVEMIKNAPTAFDLEEFTNELKKEIAKLPHEKNYNPRTVLNKVLDCVDKLKNEHLLKQQNLKYQKEGNVYENTY